MKKLIAGNWKMNCNLDEAKQLIADIVNSVFQNTVLEKEFEFLVCPPYIYLPTIRHAVVNYNVLKFGAQNCSYMENGAYTGDISAAMLKESGCDYIIAGHSERRSHHGETDEIVAAKVNKIQEHNVGAILCVGETLEQKEAGNSVDVVLNQIDIATNDSCNAHNLVVAYEPVWAIGSGKAATIDDIVTMHRAIQKKLKEKLADGANIRILYGGSVKSDNAGEILSLDCVHGCLVGGASLEADSFVGIARAASTL